MFLIKHDCTSSLNKAQTKCIKFPAEERDQDIKRIDRVQTTRFYYQSVYLIVIQQSDSNGGRTIQSWNWSKKVFEREEIKRGLLVCHIIYLECLRNS